MGQQIKNVLIVSVTPYFLEKGNFWIEENLKEILTARKTQSFFQNNTISAEKGEYLGNKRHQYILPKKRKLLRSNIRSKLRNIQLRHEKSLQKAQYCNSGLH